MAIGNTFLFPLHGFLSLFLYPFFLALSACSDNTGQTDPAIKHATVVAVGDIMLGASATEVLLKRGYNYPFTQVKPFLANADAVIGNLEGPLTSICNDEMVLDKQYVFRSPAEQVAPALRLAGFNLFSLANNHVMDYGSSGMNETISALRLEGISSVGVGSNISQARAGTIIDTSSNRLGFLSYSLTFPESFWATDSKSGAAFGHKKQIIADIKRLKQLTDNVIVSFHWGREKTTKLRPYQPTLARAAIEAGAALVIGHHPHVLQAIEQYQHGLILYSLGNFVFGSYSQEAKSSVIARITLDKGKFQNAEFIPINVLNSDVIFQPKILKNPEASTVINHLNTLSKHTNTRLDLQNARGYLHASQNKIQSMPRNN